MESGRLEGKIAVITGGASGIGLACAKRYAQEGAIIVISDLDVNRLEAAAAEIRKGTNGKVMFVEADVCHEEQIEVLMNIASSAARVALPGAVDYCVSKAGVAMLTHAFSVEMIEHNIRVNAIGPGFIETPMTQGMQDDADGTEMMLGMTPMGRLGKPLEMANTALYLACDESSYTTGATLYPNGGMHVS